jgi:hypothetical protein
MDKVQKYTSIKDHSLFLAPKLNYILGLANNHFINRGLNYEHNPCGCRDTEVLEHEYIASPTMNR